MTDAAVGSISHILQTAFKEDIDERKKYDSAQALKEAKLAKQQQREELKRLKAEAAAIAAKAAEDEAAASTSKKGGKAPPSKQQEVSDTSDPVESDDNVDDIVEEEQHEDIVENPVDLLPLAEHHKQVLLARKAEIQKELDANSKNAEQLVAYLKEQRDMARQLEIEEEERLKKQGIMVGQHIPSLKSQLEINSRTLNQFGAISSNLVVSRELLDQNKERNLRRTGNLPISEEAELRKSMRKQYKSTLDEDAPHYLEHTGTFRERSHVTAARFSATLQEHKTLRESIKLEKSAQGIEMKKTIPKRDRGQSAIEKQRDQEVLRAMNHKLNYLRNPRNNPAAVNRTLLAPSRPTCDVGAAGNVPYPSSTAKAGPSSTAPPKPPSPATVRRTVPSGPSAPPQPGGTTSTLTKRGAGSGSLSATSNALFLTEPSIVLFDAYHVGETYSAAVSFRNISTVSRSLRVIPPRTNSFCMLPLQFPANSKAGMVAPGMCVLTEITFMPQSLADYDDKLIVETEGGSYEVPVMGRRDPPILNFPSLLDIGTCLVGDSLRIATPCTNTGGAGKFKILLSEWYPDVPEDIEHTGCIRCPPFTIYPIEFALGRHETIDLTIEFLPLCLGSFQQDIVFLGDNDQYVTVTLRGTSRQVDCAIVEVNSIPVPPHDPVILKDLHFSDCSIGNDIEQEISVANATGLAIEYEWVWVEARTKDIRRTALAKMMIREEQKVDRIEAKQQKHEAKVAAAEAAAASRKRRGSLGRRNSRATIEEYPALDGSLLMSTGLDIDERFDLASRMKCFEISPGRGVLPAYGNAPFVVKFNASSIGVESGRAVLMLKDVTAAGLPEKGQEQCLEELLAKGHGPYHRLRSWIEEIGTHIPHEQTKHQLDDLFLKGLEPHNVPSNRVSLDTLMSIARAHARNACSDEAQNRFQYAVGRILSKAKRWMERTVDPNIPDDDSVCGPETILLSEEEVILDDAIAMANILVFDTESGEEMATMYPTLRVNIPRKVPVDIAENRRYINPVSMEGKKLSKILWLDSYSAFSILGSELCSTLNNKVKHEAVEFIQRISRINLPVLNINVTGAGSLPTFEVRPPKIVAGGRVSVGAKWTGQVTLHNTSQIVNEVTIDPATAIALGMKEQRNALIEVSNQSVILLPGSSETIDVSIIAREVGKFEFHLPVNAKNKYLVVDDIIISMHTIGPKVRFEASEVNLGLVSTGTETKSLLSFTNDTDVPLLFNLTCSVDAHGVLNMAALRQGKGSPSKQTSQRDEDTHSVAHSARSQLTEASIDSFGIENPHAVLTFEPPQGELAPGQTCQAMLNCLAGKFPQRIRGIAECSISDITGTCQLPSQYISVRGEVQAPLTILTPTLHDLGQVYINTPVQFEMEVKNLTSLPSKFKFDRPGGESPSYRLKFSEKSGELAGQESRTIVVHFTALVSGVTDEVIGCKIFGSSTPIGFQLKVMAKGIQVEFIPIGAEEEPPPPLAMVTDAQFPGPGPVPEPAPPKPLDFGTAVELYERGYRRFAIRNLSAMAAYFDIRPRKYDVGDVFGDVADDVSLSSSLVEPPQSGLGLLVPKEEGEFRYHSQAGKKYIGAMLKRRQDKHYLTLGLGASYSVEPKSGVVDPWGVVVVHVLSRNDMPGCFDDELVCDIRDHRKLYLPMKMTVLGCPLVIERDSYGMSSYTPPGGSEEGSSGLLLQMGYNAVNSEPIAREFRVRNNGSSPATIKWNLRSVSSKVNGPIKLELRLNPDGTRSRAKISLLYWEDVAKDSPFDVNPKVAVIPSYGRKNFKVMLLRTHSVGNELALLSGAISFGEGGDDVGEGTTVRRRSTQLSVGSRPGTGASEPKVMTENPSSNSIASAQSIKSTGNAKLSYTISLFLKGSLVQPVIRLDKHILSTSKDGGITQVPPAQGINLKADAPRLFASGTHPSEVCKKIIALTNPIPATLAFSVSIEGPYTIKLVTDSSSPKKPSAMSKVSTSLVGTSSKTKASSSGGSSVGGSCLLLTQVRLIYRIFVFGVVTVPPVILLGYG